MENNKKRINNVFYGVIGIATLMLAVIGATFAYYTATATNNTVIKGDMATMGLEVTVTKVSTTDTSGLIPLSNNMIHQAVSNASEKGICLDDNGNAVCQIYKITVLNESTVNVFVDGYVTLTGGSGDPEDFTYASGYTATTMRWAQAFCTETSGTLTSCSTGGNSTVRPSTAINIPAIGVSDTAKANGANTAEILTADQTCATASDCEGYLPQSSIIGTTTITGRGNTSYEVINKNYIRVSEHATGSYNYVKKATTAQAHNDLTSALVFNQPLDAANASNTNDEQSIYIAVWLSENGHNQNASNTSAGTPAKSGLNFFSGNATFISSQGNETTATFSGTTRVSPNTVQ